MIAILTTPDRFGLAAASKPWEAFETGCLRGKLQDTIVLDALTRPRVPDNVDKIIILGQKALDTVYPGMVLDKFRGQLTSYQNRPAIASYHPIDAFDQTGSEDSEDFLAADDNKDSARTQPSNYFFWIRRDCEKLLYQTPINHPPLKYHACPNLEKFLAYAYAHKNETVYLDIETRRQEHTLNCIGIAFGDSPVFVLPIYFYNNQKAYGNAEKILVMLNRILPNTTVVIHNSLFDLFNLARYYRVSCGWNIFDTMLCQHRMFPEAEKSLGHTISYWTYLPFHKDMSIENPHNPQQQAQLWEYNARDVYAMREVYKQQTSYLASCNDPGLIASVSQANSSVYPYLLAMLKGLPVDEIALGSTKVTLHSQLRGILRVARILSGKPTFNPNSTQQCSEYFYEGLHYEVPGKTTTGKPKMDQKNIYKLRLKYPNPLLDVVIAYRLKSKASSMLDFVPYNPPHYEHI